MCSDTAHGIYRLLESVTLTLVSLYEGVVSSLPWRLTQSPTSAEESKIINIINNNYDSQFSHV